MAHGHLRIGVLRAQIQHLKPTMDSIPCTLLSHILLHATEVFQITQQTLDQQHRLQVRHPKASKSNPK